MGVYFDKIDVVVWASQRHGEAFLIDLPGRPLGLGINHDEHGKQNNKQNLKKVYVMLAS